jgi:hypothetical protein
MAPQTLHARRTVVRPEPCLPDDRFDYADSFEVAIPHDDVRPPVRLARDGLEGAPAPLRALIVVAHRRILGFRLRPLDDRRSVLGWQVTTSTAEVAVLEATSPLMRGVIVARRDPGECVRLSTYLYHRRPVLASALWWLVGPVHRRVAPYLMVRAVTGPRG